MSRFRAVSTPVLLAAVVSLSLQPALAAVPDYKLGDVAQEDVITPVPLLVVNPDASDALKRKVAQEVHQVVLQTTQTAGEAEADLRAKLAEVRTAFIAALEQILNGRRTPEPDPAHPPIRRAIREVARGPARDLPFDLLVPLWMRGESDAAIVDSLVEPVRDVMLQTIVATKTSTSFPPGQPVRLVLVKNASEPPTLREVETAGQTVPPSKVISLWRARRLVETHFPVGQERWGKFAAGFVRANAQPEPALTDIVRAKRMEGLTVNDTYEAAQVVVTKGQTIDRKALSALALLREKSLIGTLQNKLEQEKSVVGQIRQQTKWIAATLGGACLVLLLIAWRARSRPGTALVPVGTPAPAGSDLAALPSGEGWQNRALLAEAKAERAHAAIRSGVLGWMRERIVGTLFRHRAELISAQQKAMAEMHELEQRLEQVHAPLQERISAYEQRIAELEKELAAKGEENRELIGARITVARQQLMLARERRRVGINQRGAASDPS